MAAEPVLPSMFVIGAPKCGTTSLHRYLDLHPEIAMTREKEPRLFAAPDYPRSLDRYEELLDGGAPVRGESSVVYSQHPTWSGVPERIAERVPEARFLYVVGDPVERAVAHYRQHVRDGKEARPIAEALADHRDPGNVYVAPSRYATQLDRYLERFDRSQILVIDQGDLAARREATLERAFEFLGVDPAFRSPGFAERLNTREHLRESTRLGAVLRGSGATGLARRALGPGMRGRLRRLVSRPIEHPELPPALRRELAAGLAEEVDRLRELTGERFGGWSL